MKKIATNWNNFDPESEQNFEVNKEPSMTIPEQTMSLQELIKRFTRGQSVATLTPVFEADEMDFEEGLILPDLDKLTQIESAELAHQMKHHIKEERNRIIAKANAKKEPDEQETFLEKLGNKITAAISPKKPEKAVDEQKE